MEFLLIFSSGSEWWRCSRAGRDWPARRGGNCSRTRRAASRGHCSSEAHRSWCSGSWLGCAGWTPNRARTRRLHRPGTRQWSPCSRISPPASSIPRRRGHGPQLPTLAGLELMRLSRALVAICRPLPFSKDSGRFWALISAELFGKGVSLSYFFGVGGEERGTNSERK